MQVVFLDDEVRPHFFHELALGNRALVLLDQGHQHVEASRAELDRYVAVEQLPLLWQEPKGSETVLLECAGGHA
ncbi:MAG: hypothetical protein WKH97_18275 [Casimicrobiaceae bacterium]